MSEAKKYERLDRKLIRRGAVIDYYVDSVQIPDAGVEEWDFIDHKGAAAVVAVLDDGRILMVRQYRNALDRFTLELPAGGRSNREEPTRECAERELEEETGYRCKELTKLLSFRSTVAFCNELIDIYLATGLTPGARHLDPDEFLDVEAVDPEELERRIYAGEMEDGKTLAGLLAYFRFRDRNKA